VATPTEGGAMGAVGAIIMALLRRRLNLTLLRQAMDTTATLSCFVVFILIGSTVFGLTFRGVNGDLWVEHLLIGLPGGQMGFLIVVSLMTFVLAFFLDFFELAFIIVPLLGPVADKMGIDLIWFGVLLAVNMQTSFMHPPFGFALFYLRSVAPKDDYRDKVTGKMIAKVTTGDIYWGSIPFIVIQLIMVAMVLLVPGMVTHYKQGVVKMDIESVKIDIDGAYGDQGGYGESQGYYGDVHVDPAPSSEGAPAAAGDGASASDEEFNNLFK
jgi:TRAP-type mannitol/chloroaromatic compound transport system permease large subunit